MKNVQSPRSKTDEAIRREYDSFIEQEAKPESALFEVGKQFLSRNRYINILPYEPTRFTIKNEPNFYFNANWVLDKTAIACQGPQVEEINEFWKMVWKSKAISIVMLTNLNEKNVEKCSSYWPLNKSDNGIKKYKDIQVTFIKKETLFHNDPEKIVRRDFKLKKNGKERALSHFHLKNWPDHGSCPPTVLAKLVMVVNDHRNLKKKSFIVHCSAGVGRTGTFLTAFEAYQQKTDFILPILKNLRDPNKGRVGMVQNAEQYLTAYKATQMLTLDFVQSRVKDTY